MKIVCNTLCRKNKTLSIITQSFMFRLLIFEILIMLFQCCELSHCDTIIKPNTIRNSVTHNCPNVTKCYILNINSVNVITAIT